MSLIPWDDDPYDLPWPDPEPRPNPRCRLCGAVMAVKRYHGDAVIWHCWGVSHWNKWDGPIYDEGRWPNDRHSIQSQLATRR